MPKAKKTSDLAKRLAPRLQRMTTLIKTSIALTEGVYDDMADALEAHNSAIQSIRKSSSSSSSEADTDQTIN